MALAAEVVGTIADHWWVLLIRGIVGIIFGALFIFYPGITLVALLYLFGAYALVDGVFALIQAFRLGVHSDRWWPLIFEAIVGVAVGIVFFRFTGLSAVVVAFVIAVWAITTGIFELVAAFRFGGSGGAPWLLGIGGVLSIIVGIIFAWAPIEALLAYVWVLGIYAIIFGVMLIVWSFRLRSAAPTAPADAAS
ncbi:MAG TPA: HdeD family acid-resistance protein [Candidatus Eremiobacteraceae bacterium]|nr:HdeD family acid-resistance protein [Candidatus Eremiobacteraceae bacterium]